VQSTLDYLIERGEVTKAPGSATYSVQASLKQRIEVRIESAKNLESSVKTNWLQQCKEKFTTVDGDLAWTCLQHYLSKLFRRHGLQTVLLLDATADGTDAHAILLRSSLDYALTAASCGGEQRPVVENSIHLFLETVGTDADRTKFIVQLADGAFSYYSLSAPPEVAQRLQDKLKELTLFLDTNFLFGLLGLHVNPLDAVSEELISVIRKNRLPFKLRYHEATLLEMRRTIIGITTDLKGRHWPQALSRAALRSPYVSSIERKFHEKNAVATLDPEAFFQPYEHPDVLLKDHDILIFRQPVDRLLQKNELIHQYEEFLTIRHREKPYEAIDHDMTVLDTVRHQRSKARSTLDAKALMITCDTILSRFDWQELRTDTEMACTALPNQFLQLLRPFVSASSEFDKSFAESFAIAEFRTIGSSARASSKLLSLLSTYKDIKEETASALLANELLLEKLKKSKDDRQFKEFVDAALLAENSMLLEEVMASKKQADKERAERQAREAEKKRMEEERDELLLDKEDTERKLLSVSQELESTKSESAGTFKKMQESVEEAQKRASVYQSKLDTLHSAGSVLAAILLAGLFVFVSESWLFPDWQWLMNHPNSYALRASFYLAITSFLVGLFNKSWRAYLWWGSAGFAALLVIVVGLLGGPPPAK